MFLKHVHQARLEGNDPVPLGLLHPVAALLVDVALVGGDGQVRDATAAREMVDGDVGARSVPHGSVRMPW